MASPSTTPAVPPPESPSSTLPRPDIQAKYTQERQKRLRADGIAQYIELASAGGKHFAPTGLDPWVSHETLNAETPALTDGTQTPFLVIGAGLGGLLFAARLVDAGVPVADIRLVDAAGGYGGTWYWNRYPGLMCDIESYCYMPLLEETGYMPRHRYAYGEEVREYAELIAQKWGFMGNTLFRTSVQGLRWDDSEKEWEVRMSEDRGPEQGKREIVVKAGSVFWGCGMLNHPQIPDLKGAEAFGGHAFHTSRWDYGYTGGSPTDTALTGLKGKKVGIIGTGATAIQVVPELAKWADHLYVFQRTPSAVDERGQRPTDPEWWKEMTKKKGWQRERQENFNAHLSNEMPAPSVDMVDDGLSHMKTSSALVGGPMPEIITPDKAAAHVSNLHALDMVRSERVRARVDEIIEDKETAEKLKAWYPGWCKRPTFHDDYLPALNRPNVTLVDTDGKGVEGLSGKGIMANGQEYPVDLLVFSTGYISPLAGGPAHRGKMKIIGRNGVSLDEKWKTEGVGTLHGVVSRDFPNLFFAGPSQAGIGAGQGHTLDVITSHVAYIVCEGRRKAEGSKCVIEPTERGQEEWTMQVMSRAAAFAAVAGCTPSYHNREGEVDRVSKEDQMKMARGAIWGQGFASYTNVIDEWRRQGGLEGLVVGV